MGKDSNKVVMVVIVVMVVMVVMVVSATFITFIPNKNTIMSILVGSFRQSFAQMSVPAKLLLLVILVLFFALLGSFVAVLLAIPLYHNDLGTLYQIIENPDSEHIGVIKFFQIIQTIFLFIIPGVLTAWLFSENAIQFLKFNRKVSWITLLLVLISIFSAVPMLNMITSWNSQLDLPAWLGGLERRMLAMEESAAILTQLFLESGDLWVLTLNILMIAILPAVGEELMFRGVIQRLFSDWTRNAHAGIIITALLFSFIHFQFYGFLPRFLLGLYFGYLMWWTGSLWIPIAAHFINNGMAVVYYHFSAKPVGSSTLDTVGTDGNGNFIVYLSVFLTCLIAGIIYLYEKREQVSRD